MYETLIFIHSWTRWAVFGGIIYFLIKSINGWLRKTPWTPSENHFIWAFNQVFGYQILFGLTLWIGISPMTKMGFQNWSLVFDNAMFAFWVLRHPLTMVFSLGIFHMGKAKARRASPENRFKIYSVTFALVFAMVTSAIPWPWLSYGRSLFRWFL